jgi:SET domain
MIDLEAHGALYTLHSHLNHSCSPNVSVRHIDQRIALSRIRVIAKCDIAVGEELVVTYVNPDLGVRERRSQLSAWGFGQCNCERCIKEEKEGEGEVQKRSDMDELERELKAGLGVM